MTPRPGGYPESVAVVGVAERQELRGGDDRGADGGSCDEAARRLAILVSQDQRSALKNLVPLCEPPV